MSTSKRLSLLIATLIMSLVTTQGASANKYPSNPYVNYDLLCQSADSLQYAANDLKDYFAADFRHTGHYGKLVSRSNRIKHAAKRLHRRGLSKSAYNWRSEIQKLDDLVCELAALVDKSVYYSRGHHAIHPKTLRNVRSLMVSADQYVTGLERSLRKVNRHNSSSYGKKSRYSNPAPVIIQEPLRYNDVAPSYAPRSQSGRNYRPSYRENYTRHHYRDLGSKFASKSIVSKR